jgi:hypothetical protein
LDRYFVVDKAVIAHFDFQPGCEALEVLEKKRIGEILGHGKGPK